jgi:uncharacterized protein
MRLHEFLEWDKDKAAKNLKKHHVSFDDAARVLADEEGDFYHVDEFDELHADDEDRYLTTASDPNDRRIVMRISWTDRSTHKRQITRIISARLATSRERKSYAQEIHRKSSGPQESD